MAIQEEHITLMEKYLDASLNAQEKLSFEKALEADSELKDEFQNRKKLREIWIQTKEYEDTRAKIKSILQIEKHKKKTRRLWFAVSVAASVIILLSSYWFINQSQREADFETPVLLSDDKQAIDNQLHIDGPTTYAKMDSVGAVKLISPINKQVLKADTQILFQWSSSLTQVDTLSIYSAENNRIIFQVPISLCDSTAKIKANLWEAGYYYWKFNGQQNKGEFIIQ